MSPTCTGCGEPVGHVEQHHVDQQRGNNEPDNLTPRCRECHHDGAHDNPRAVDKETNRKYGPKTPSGTGAPSFSGGGPW